MTYGKLSEDNPVWIMYLVKINHLLLAINSAINIVIYSFKVMKYNILVWTWWREIISLLLSFSQSVFSLQSLQFSRLQYLEKPKPFFLTSYTVTVTNNPFLLSIESNSEIFLLFGEYKNENLQSEMMVRVSFKLK